MSRAEYIRPRARQIEPISATGGRWQIWGNFPAKMTAIAISEPGGPLVLKPEKRDVPEPGEGEILIRVRAAGVNRPDVLQRKGAYPPPPGASDLPGLEVAGEVAALGAGVKRWRVGDRGLRADAGRRLCRIRQACTRQRAAAAGRLHLHRGGGAAGNLLHRLAQCVRARRAEERRDAAGAWRLVRHRHHGDPARHGASAPMSSPPPARPRNATACLKLGADRADQLPRARISSRRSRRRPTARAPMSSSTWSAATMSRATTRRRRWKAASCRSPRRAGPSAAPISPS